MTLLALVHLLLTLPLGVTQLSSEFGGRNLTCITLPLSLRSGPGRREPVTYWAPPETLPRAGSGLAWDWKVKSAPCRDVAVSWKFHTNMDSNLAFTSIMKVILYFGLPSIDSLVLFLSLFRTQASKRCYLLCPLKVIYHSYLTLWPRKDLEEDTIFVHLTDEKLRIRRIKGPKVKHCLLV